MFKFLGGFLVGAIVGAILVARFYPRVTVITAQPTAAITTLVAKTAPVHAEGPLNGPPVPELVSGPAVTSCGSFTNSMTALTAQLRAAASSDLRVKLLECSDQANMHNLHGLFAAEPRDVEWAGSMEEHLKAGLAKDAAWLQLTLGRIQCRQTICEVQAVGPADMNAVTWHHEVIRMSQEPWWTFRTIASTSIQQHGLSQMLTALRRPPPVFELN